MKRKIWIVLLRWRGLENPEETFDYPAKIAAWLDSLPPPIEPLNRNNKRHER